MTREVGDQTSHHFTPLFENPGELNITCNYILSMYDILIYRTCIWVMVFYDKRFERASRLHELPPLAASTQLSAVSRWCTLHGINISPWCLAYLFESMMFLFPQVGIFPKQPKTNRQKYQGLLKNSWRLRELPGTRVRRDLPGYPGIPPQLQLWNMQDEELKEHAGRLQESSEVGPCIGGFFSKKTVVGCVFYRRVMFVCRKTKKCVYMQGRHWRHYLIVCICIYIYCKLCDYVYKFISCLYQYIQYRIIYHHIPWYTIMIYNYTMYHDIS